MIVMAGISAISLAWKGIASDWNNYFAPPSRISNGELKKYKEWIARVNKRRKPLSALVLGATPELRDALVESGYKLCSIDINIEMFLAMDGLLKHKSSTETLVKANWLDNPFPEGYFDLVVGDAVLPNVPWEERGNLLAEVKRVLKPGGVFLTRAFCAPDKRRFRSVDEIMVHFSKKKPNAQSALEMVLELQLLDYNTKKHLCTFAAARDALVEYHRINGMRFTNKNLQKIHDMVWNFWCKKFINKVFIYAYRKDEEREYKKYFNMVEVFETRDHEYSKITPMYFLKAR